MTTENLHWLIIILRNTNQLKQRQYAISVTRLNGFRKRTWYYNQIKRSSFKVRAKTENTYTFHLIDTPAHVDFTYEVSRSLAACEGAILVVDAAQGIEINIRNVYLALDNELELLPVINKIDLPAAEPERVKQEIQDMYRLDEDHVVLASAKSNIGIEEILEKIIEVVPAPDGDPEAPL